MNTPLYCVSRFRNVRRHHRYLMGKDPSLAPAVFGGGMVLPNGAVALPLVDGSIAVYEVHAVVQYYCRSAQSRGSAVEMALNAVADLDRCVRAAAKPEVGLPHIRIAAA